MIDLDLIRQNPEIFEQACKVKNIKVDVRAFLKLDEARRTAMVNVQKMQAERNAVSKTVPTIKDKTEQEKVIAAMKTLARDLQAAEKLLEPIEKEWLILALQLPSPPLRNVPVGKDDTQNVEIRKAGKLPSFSFDPLDHIVLGTALDIIDIPRAVKIAGARTYFLKGDGVRLEMAILAFTLETLVKKGYTPFSPPLLVHYDAMMGTSYFPGGEEQAYAVGVQQKRGGMIESDEAYLIGTSEVSVTSYHQDEVLELAGLPRRYCGISPCFRREAGNYGKDTHGLYRIHQFQKVEQVILCENDPKVSARMHAEILQNAEDVLQALKLPYRVVDVCTGDLGRGQVYKNDIETWMPSRKSYGETHSCSTFYDFQTRRLNIKYKAADGTKQFCHSLNNTCIASPRILIPILEIYQNKDGSVTIPEVLRPYMGGQHTITPRQED